MTWKNAARGGEEEEDRDDHNGEERDAAITPCRRLCSLSADEDSIPPLPTSDAAMPIVLDIEGVTEEYALAM